MARCWIHFSIESKGMLLSNQICERARLARDARFDGRFFIGVKTTGIYCRPICPVKMPLAKNVKFFASAAAASEAGFRPCLRCRPECAPGSPAWYGSSTTVRRGLRLLAEGALEDGDVAQLAARLGVTDRHLRRLFKKYLGASPTAVAQTGRLHFAKRLLDETSLTMTQVAMAAGYGSLRRFNDQFIKTYQRPPRELRKRNQTLSGNSGSGLSLHLSTGTRCFGSWPNEQRQVWKRLSDISTRERSWSAAKRVSSKFAQQSPPVF